MAEWFDAAVEQSGEDHLRVNGLVTWLGRWFSHPCPGPARRWTLFYLRLLHGYGLAGGT